MGDGGTPDRPRSLSSLSPTTHPTLGAVEINCVFPDAVEGELETAVGPYAEHGGVVPVIPPSVEHVNTTSTLASIVSTPTGGRSLLPLVSRGSAGEFGLRRPVTKAAPPTPRPSRPCVIPLCHCHD